MTRPSSSLISDVWHWAGWENTYLELKFLLLRRNTNTKKRNTNKINTIQIQNWDQPGLARHRTTRDPIGTGGLPRTSASPGKRTWSIFWTFWIFEYFEFLEFWIFRTFGIVNVLNFLYIWKTLGPHLEANVHRERDDVVVEYHPQQEHLQNPKN